MTSENRDPAGERQQGQGREQGREDGRNRARKDEGPPPANIGKGDTPNVSGSDVQQPEIAEGPVEGLQPGEKVERGPWQPPVEVDPPPGYGRPPARGGATPSAPEPDREAPPAARDLPADRGVPAPPHDPGAAPEDEGIPDLQDGGPEQRWASDPQQASVPGDEPTVVTREGVTFDEQVAGRSLDDRLGEEEPEPDPAELAEPGAGASADGTAEGAPEPDEAPAGPGAAEEPAGLLYDEPDPDRPREQDVHSQEGSTDGLSAEEEAIRIRDDEKWED